MNREAAAGTAQRASEQRVVDLRGADPILIDTQVYARQESRYERWVKPVLDRIGAALLLVLALPLLIACAAVIRMQMGGPVLLRQPRVGHKGRIFVLYKFRTMVPDRRQDAMPFAGRERRINHKTAGDPRITPVGRILRELSLDELPQFWNVLIGDMSLVGPRPELPEIVARYDGWQHRRHTVRPGITGRWQISERGNRPLHEATSLDLEYIEKLSVWEDLSIMSRTPFAMFGKRSGI